MTTSKTLTLKKSLDFSQKARLSQALNPPFVEEEFYPEKTVNNNKKPLAGKVVLKEEKKKPQKNKQQKKGISADKSADEAAYARVCRKRKEQKEGILWLCMTYPACFNREAPKPLTVGIFTDILIEGLWPYSKTLLRRTLSLYTRSFLYHQAILHMSQRCFLNGEVAQDIAEFEKENARKNIQFLQERQKTKRRKTDDNIDSEMQAE